jgi:hypothetical protein
MILAINPPEAIHAAPFNNPPFLAPLGVFSSFTPTVFPFSAARNMYFLLVSFAFAVSLRFLLLFYRKMEFFIDFVRKK